MTKKEMINKIEELKTKAFNNSSDKKYSNYMKLKAELLKETGYTKKYDGRLYLQKSARKEQIELYLTAVQIAYDMIYNS